MNNFNLIESYIRMTNFDFGKDNDEYYTIEVIRRGKDNPDLPAANYHIKNYYIKSFNELLKREKEIIELCKMYNARAYFAVNRKSFKQVMLNTVAEMARRVAVHDYTKPYNIYESCSGKYFHDSDKKWIIDVDVEPDDKFTLQEKIENYLKAIEPCDPKGVEKVILTIPTINGCHIITRPFNVAMFNENLRNMDMMPFSEQANPIIKKNHLTLAYYDKNNN